jgi:large subunit ribosomal protein L31
MAKQGIHPQYHSINIVMTDGTKYQTRSTYGKEGDTLQLDVDPKTHPAWVGGVHLKKTGRLESFNARFGGINAINKAPGASGDAKPAAAPKVEKKEAAPAAKAEKKPAAAAKPEKKAAPKADKKA